MKGSFNLLSGISCPHKNVSAILMRYRILNGGCPANGIDYHFSVSWHVFFFSHVNLLHTLLAIRIQCNFGS